MTAKKRKGKSKLLAKKIFQLLQKKSPISARNVPKLPAMSLFEPRKKSKKRTAISKVALK